MINLGEWSDNKAFIVSSATWVQVERVGHVLYDWRSDCSKIESIDQWDASNVVVVDVKPKGSEAIDQLIDQ